MGQPGDEGGPFCCEPVLLVGGLGMLFGCIWSFLVPDTSLTGALPWLILSLTLSRTRIFPSNPPNPLGSSLSLVRSCFWPPSGSWARVFWASVPLYKKNPQLVCRSPSCLPPDNQMTVWEVVRVLSWLSYAAALPSQSPAESYFTIYLHVIMAIRCRY